MSDRFLSDRQGRQPFGDSGNEATAGSTGRQNMTPPTEDKFDQDKVANYIHDALNKGDSDNNGILSFDELQQRRKHDKTPADAKASEFITKHFGALSVMNTDTVSKEGGITHQDALNLHGNFALLFARSSFIEKYCERGCTAKGAQDFRRYFDRNFKPQIKTMLDDLKNQSSK